MITWVFRTVLGISSVPSIGLCTSQHNQFCEWRSQFILHSVKSCAVMWSSVCQKEETHLSNVHKGTQWTRISCTRHHHVSKNNIPSSPGDLRFSNTETRLLLLTQCFFIYITWKWKWIFPEKSFMFWEMLQTLPSFKKIHCKLVYWKLTKKKKRKKKTSKK